MSVVKPNSNIVKTDYDRTDEILRSTHQVSFDLQDLVALVEEQAARGLTGTALSIPPLKLRQLCGEDKNNTNRDESNNLHSFRQQQQQQQQSGNNSKSSSSTTGAVGEGLNNTLPSTPSSPSSSTFSSTTTTTSKLFSQAIWDRGVHLFRLLRHLGKPHHTVPSIHYRPGELLTKIDQYNTELELLLLRSRSGKGSDDELCFQFVKGCCPRGASCSFSHNKIAVSTWSQRWANEHLRDFTHYRSLLKQHLIQTNSNLFKKHHLQLQASAQLEKDKSSSQQQQQQLQSSSPTTAKKNGAVIKPLINEMMNLQDVSPITSSSNIASKNAFPNNKYSSSNTISGNNININKLAAPSAFDDRPTTKRLESIMKNFQVPVHALSSGAVLRFDDDLIGPEALSVALDMLQKRDEFLDRRRSEEASGGGGAGATLKESKLSSIVIRQPIAKPVFDVLCSMIDLTLFVDLRAVDLSRCDLGSSTLGRSRFAKFGKVLRRSSENRFDPDDALSNRMCLSLGSNGILNGGVAAFLNGFASVNHHQHHNVNSQQFSRTSDTNNIINSSFTTTSASNNSPQHPGLNNASFANMSFMSANAATLIAKGGGTQQQRQQQNTTSNEHTHHTTTSSTTGSGNNNHVGATVNSLVDTSLLLVSSMLPMNSNNNNNNEGQNTASSSNAPPIIHHPLLSLNLEFNQIGPSMPDFSEFISSLQDCLPHIEKLSLAGNPIVYDGASRLFPTLRLNGPILTAFHQQVVNNGGGNSSAGNNGGVAVAVAVTNETSTTSASSPSSASDNINNNAIAIAVASAATTTQFSSLSPSILIAQKTPFCALQYLDVSGCGLGDRGVTLLCETVKFNGNNMKYLNVGWNGITADGAAAQLADLLRQKHTMLACLRLDYSPQVGRRGAILFSQAIKENSSIRRLDMRWCGIGDEGALAILDSLGTSRNMSLAVFNFDSNEVDSRTKDALDEKLGLVSSICQEELMAMDVEIVW